MLTPKDKAKELVEYFAQSDKTQCFVFKNYKYKNYGVSEVITCQFSLPGLFKVVYDQRFVESFDLAKKMDLPGIEKHGKLISPVTIEAPNLGVFQFKGQPAISIKSACELNRDLMTYLISNNISQK